MNGTATPIPAGLARGLLSACVLLFGFTALLAVGMAGGGAYSGCSTAMITAILLPFCTAMALTFLSAIAFL